MKRYLYPLLIILSLAACQQAAPVTDTPTSEAVAQPEPLEATAVPPTAVPPTATTATETAAPTTTAVVPAPATTDLPRPTLFNSDWRDRSPYQAGLIASQQEILDQLPHAPIYHMDLQIDDTLTTITGRLEMLYTNQEDTTLELIYFHLFPNLLGGEITIDTLFVDGNIVEPQFESFNGSILRVSLPTPMAPTETAVIQLNFVTVIPTESGRNYGILATIDGVMALAHFYPQLVIYDESGWNLEVPSEQGDVTYADTSFYLVRVTLPAEQIMAASGVEIDKVISDTTQTITLAAGPMRDFYLASSANYKLNSQTVGETTINNYAPAAFDAGATVALDFAAQALTSFSSRLAVYPFTELDMVGTPTLALGIEYPGIIANRATLYDLDTNNFGVPTINVLESTTVHEVGHQWFYSLVGNNQLNEPWLDESITQYITWLYFVDRYGKENAEGFYQTLDQRWRRVDYDDVPIGLPVGEYEGVEYSAIVYGRGPIFVRTLAEAMGEETFDAFLYDYVQSNLWGLGTTSEFKQLAESHCDCDLTELFNTWVLPQS